MKNRNKNDNAWRALRGGDWLDYPEYCRAASRDGDGPDLRYYYLGFRPVFRLAKR